MNPKIFLNPRLRFAEEPVEENGGAAAEAPEEKAPEAKEPEAKKEPEDELPAWAKDELSRTRREAARYRTERNTLKEQIKDAKSADEVQALVAEYEEKLARADLDLARERVARSANLPDELAARLKGSTEEELKADAETLKQFARPARGGSDPKGGLDPSVEPDAFDSEEAALHILSQF